VCKGTIRSELLSTFILIHGAYQGGWIWGAVSERLQAQGHRVYAPTLDGCGERSGSLRAGINTQTHGEDIARLLFYEDIRDAVLVGTSSGGMVMACAAEQAIERVDRVVFADALALFNGEKIRDIVTRPAAINTADALGPSREDAEGRMFADLDPTLRSWASERVTLHPQAVFNEPVLLNSFWEKKWNASVLYCTGAPNPGRSHIERCAQKINGRWHQLDTGHYPMLSAPDALCDFIVDG
jgi:pimeloyl-ACP methyl ester carboxylesterase